MTDPKNTPSGFITTPSIADNLKMVSEVFKQIEKESVEIAEMLFEYLIEVSDDQVITGNIPQHPNPRINRYLAILNRMFALSRKHNKEGSFRILSRNTIETLDKKTYTICMCFDGGVSLDILCDVVNTENSARTPTKSPIKIDIRQFATSEIVKGSVRT